MTSNPTIDGAILIAGRAVQAVIRFTALDAATGGTLAPDVSEADTSHVAEAARLAEGAAPAFAAAPPETRARLLERIAGEIEAIGDPLIVTAMRESGLPRARLEGERGRTTGQLRLFATHLRRGHWAQATIDHTLPDRLPAPRPDIRRVHHAIGPVAVFGASNFPLAFSTAGGDTASALAAGCPVIVKGHPAHPATGELVARAIGAAIAAEGLDPGLFSYLPGSTHDLGRALVTEPCLRAVGFTGSRAGGLALMAVAAARPLPIPVYAEMSSINPVLLFPAALTARAEVIATGFVASLTQGSGQFCTNPGLILGLAGPDLDRFATAAAGMLARHTAEPMLTRGIRASFDAGVAALTGHAGVTELARGTVGDGIAASAAALFATDAAIFLTDPALAHEVFGAASLIVRCTGLAQMAAVVAALEGQLTATLHIDPADEAAAAALLPLLAEKAGRVLANGWPTGVEVSDAIIHGGPFPATSDGRTTSVGTAAIDRFLRPVCYQNLPDALLPPALRQANPWELPRMVDGVLRMGKIRP